MMEDPAKIPLWANGKRLRADPVAKVLGDDDLLMEIIVHVGFLTTLIRAAFVCKHWLCRVSDPAFLRRFRDRHPPRPLGFYVRAMADREPAIFVPMLPQPPELNTVIPCANFMLDIYKGKHINLDDCQNNNVFIRYRDDARPLADTTVAHNLLCHDTGKTVFPEFPPYQLQDDMICMWRALVSKAKGDKLSYLYVWIEYTRGSRECTMHVCMLQDGAWCMHASITSIHLHRVLKTPRPLVVDNKLYMASSENILVMDLLASTLSIVKFPQAGLVKYGMRNAMMSRADDDSGVYLIHANKLQLGIWLHKEDKWLMVDTICLREMLDNLRMSDQTFEDDHNEVVHINQLGNNAEFVLLQTGQSILYLDIKCRMLLKVYELAKCATLQFIYPFMMTWPPTFPRLEENPARKTIQIYYYRTLAAFLFSRRFRFVEFAGDEDLYVESAIRLLEGVPCGVHLHPCGLSWLCGAE